MALRRGEYLFPALSQGYQHMSGGLLNPPWLRDLIYPWRDSSRDLSSQVPASHLTDGRSAESTRMEDWLPPICVGTSHYTVLAWKMVYLIYPVMIWADNDCSMTAMYRRTVGRITLIISSIVHSQRLLMGSNDKVSTKESTFFSVALVEFLKCNNLIFINTENR